MSHPTGPDVDDDMLPEYDFSKGVRGKHHQAYKAGTNVVFLDPDVAAAFGDSTSVNQALRLLLKLAKESPIRSRSWLTSGTPTALRISMTSSRKSASLCSVGSSLTRFGCLSVPRSVRRYAASPHLAGSKRLRLSANG